MRRRDISCIWIDALCILQDSGQDWSQEACEMGGVYANSYCTFAAMDSPHAHSDMFDSRLPFEHTSHTIEDRDIIPIDPQLGTDYRLLKNVFYLLEISLQEDGNRSEMP